MLSNLAGGAAARGEGDGGGGGGRRGGGNKGNWRGGPGDGHDDQEKVSLVDCLSTNMVFNKIERKISGPRGARFAKV